MLTKRRRPGALIFCVLALFLAGLGLARGIDIPSLRGRINDNAGVLSTASVQRLERRLADLEKASPDKAQIAVLLPATLGGESVEEYSIAVARAWKIGQADKDNGVLLLIAPSERKIRVEVGRGLEGSLTDIGTRTGVIEAIKPHLKKGSEDYAAAIDAGITALVAAMVVEAPQVANSDRKAGAYVFLILVSAVVVFVLFVIAFVLRRQDDDESPLAMAGSAGSMAGAGRYGSASALGAAAAMAATTSNRPRPSELPKARERKDRPRSSDSGLGGAIVGGVIGGIIGSSLGSSGSSPDSSSSSDSGGSFSGGGGSFDGGGSSSDF